ncbi:uncharacterized protein LOC111914352 [Lactuca sativa]|uniref:uncharacterized protein LOC111914352 n=1 Tax=Lactuca sativa TaxID=4236 RepID=UPI000CD98D59|nr:uncharacterized protein LOC111914352 [Lactuca sativa]
MIRSIEEEDKPAKRGKKSETQKEVRVTKPVKGQTPKKRKSNKTAPSQPKQKKMKNTNRRLILQSSSDSDFEYVPPGNKPPTPTESESKSSNKEASPRGDTPPRSPTPEVPVPSSPPATIPISLPATFLVITSQPTSTIPIPNPIFSDATKTATTGAQTNVSDTRVLYSVQSDEDDDAPLNKKHLKEVSAKLDTIIASSSSHTPNSESAIQKMLDSFVIAHEASISRATESINTSTKVSIEATEKVDKLIQDANILLESLQGSTASNASKVTNSITKLEEAFAAEKQNFVHLRQDIQKDNAGLLSSLNECLTKLQDDLAMENSLVDELARKTTQLKTKNLQLSQANNEVTQLRSERVVVKSCVSDIHAILLGVLEAHDPILTISIRRHLSDKLCPSLGMLSRIEGVYEAVLPPKQGGEGLTSSSQPPLTSQPEIQKPEHSTGSGPKGKGKGPIVDDSDEEEETIVDALK